ncbi:hypothetical protein HUJ05_001833 [Dendroctonus ponderosae]|nr:hypothetical protein HUJ05_001833 [Dendroctonus ponderosae]
MGKGPSELIALIYLVCLIGCEAILNSGSIFTNDPPPMFVSREKTFRVVTGDTVVLPCEINNLEKPWKYLKCVSFYAITGSKTSTAPNEGSIAVDL